MNLALSGVKVTEDMARLQQLLLGRRHAIANEWYAAIARTSFVPFTATEMRQRLLGLTEEAIALLFTEPFDRCRAEAIGASLACFHYVAPQSLGRTQEVLAQHLLQGLTADQLVDLVPRLTALLGALATGFSRQACQTVLAEQEWIHGAVTREVRRAHEALRKAYAEVEQQVQDRTAELRAANERLRREIVERIQAEQALRASEEALRKARDELEMRVQERTAELTQANEALQAEIIERKQAEERIREHQERLRTMASQLSLAEERERRRLAMALHDRVAQNLLLSHIKLEVLQGSLSLPDLAESLDEICKLLEQIIHEIRSLTFEISSPILYELGLAPALDWLTRQTQKEHGIPSEFWDDRQPKPLDEDVQVLLYQAVRELLINVVKHAQAQRVRVSMRRDNTRIRIAVEDNGVGFDSSDISSPWSKAESFGLFSIRERLSTIGGCLEIQSRPGNGTRVTLVAPLAGERGTMNAAD